ncbi:MAG: hypothetical protein K1W14_06445 [Muribaculaceae bacterium]
MNKYIDEDEIIQLSQAIAYFKACVDKGKSEVERFYFSQKLSDLRHEYEIKLVSFKSIQEECREREIKNRNLMERDKAIKELLSEGAFTKEAYEEHLDAIRVRNEEEKRHKDRELQSLKEKYQEYLAKTKAKNPMDEESFLKSKGFRREPINLPEVTYDEYVEEIIELCIDENNEVKLHAF